MSLFVVSKYLELCSGHVQMIYSFKGYIAILTKLSKFFNSNVLLYHSPLFSIILLVIFANIGMGCKIDLDVVKEVLRRPIAPSIGFCCQFIVMPLVRILLYWKGMKFKDDSKESLRVISDSVKHVMPIQVG